MRSGQPPSWDAVVVGGGPAGSTAALHLARAGLRVLILEKQSWPRYKTCGGGVVWKARRDLEADIGSSVETETHRAELHLQDAGASFVIARSVPLVSMTMRSEFDRVLASAAIEAGAVLETSCALTHIDHQAGGLHVRAGHRSFHAQFLIAADGAAGDSAALAGWPPHRHQIPAIESEIRVDPATLQRFSGVARFDFGLVPAGYAWVFPKKQGLSVGCLSYQRHRPDLKFHLGAYLDQLGIESLEKEDHGFVIPVAPRARRLAENRVLLTGDSAGLADPVTCEGISHAILSGRLAAAAIVNHCPDSEAVTRSYQHSLKTAILSELRCARTLARLLYGAPPMRRFAFRRLGQPLSEAMGDVISGDLTYRQLLSRPSSYLHAARSLFSHRDTYPNG